MKREAVRDVERFDTRGLVDTTCVEWVANWVPGPTQERRVEKPRGVRKGSATKWREATRLDQATG